MFARAAARVIGAAHSSWTLEVIKSQLLAESCARHILAWLVLVFRLTVLLLARGRLPLVLWMPRARGGGGGLGVAILRGRGWDNLRTTPEMEPSPCYNIV